MAVNPNPPAGSIEEQALSALLDVIRAGATPEAAQAQAMLLRRVALEGDVVASRLPAPRNVTEAMGYVNLLTDLGELDVRSQVIASLLGVSGPAVPLGALSSTPAVSWVTMANDRPAGAAQPVIPLSINIRGDFAPALQSAIKTLHAQGCQLPLMTPPLALPAPVIGGPTVDPMPYLGRVLTVVPATALADPDQDAVVLARQGTDPFALAARVLSPGSVAVASAPWEALTCDSSACTPSPAPAAGRQYVPLAPGLASAGFYASVPPAEPTSNKDSAWSVLRNITALVAGTTTLGDELRLLYSVDEIASSCFSSQLQWTWDGTAFKQP